MKTPKILWPANRQYRHNNNDKFITAYDKEKTDRIVYQLLIHINSQDKIIKQLKSK